MNRFNKRQVKCVIGKRVKLIINSFKESGRFEQCETFSEIPSKIRRI